MSLGGEEALVGAVLTKRWHLVRYLGGGAIGQVYEAADRRGGASRAIKLLRHEHTRRPEITRRFVVEARAMTQLNHPNIVRADEVGIAENGTPYIVMPLLAGAPLSALASAERGIEPEAAAQIVCAVLRALEHAHRAGIVHRDVKPENVFVASLPSGEQSAVLLDFSAAKVLDELGGYGKHTATGAMIGTPAYMSPEQLRDSSRVDRRSDLWAAGVLLYQLLTGALPFSAADPVALLFAVLEKEPTPIASKRPELARWSGFFAQALARAVDQRFATAGDMAAALVPLGKERPPIVQPLAFEPTEPCPPEAAESTPLPNPTKRGW